MSLVGKLTGLALGVAALAGGGFVVDRAADLREARAEFRYGPLGQMVDVNGTQVHALVTGSGPDLVLIHGASGNLRDFTFALVDQLKDRYRVIAFDRPGLGWTDRLPAYQSLRQTQGESPREQARLLQAAADQLGVRNPIVLGHSYGGAVALAWGLERPEQTAAIVALAAVSNPWPGSLSPLYRINSSRFGGAVVVPLLSAFVPKSRVTSAVETIFTPDPVPQGYVGHIGGPLSLRRTSLRANAQQIWTLRPHIVEMAPLYRDVLTMPVEIIHGTADTIVPPDVHAEVLAAQLQNARYTRLDGVGHMPQHARPDAVIEAIDRVAKRAAERASKQVTR